MANYKGLEHYSKGQTSIETDGLTLTVSNFGNTSFDGVSIETNGASEWEATINPINLTPGVIMGATYNIRDNANRNKVVAQYSTSDDPATGNVIFSSNSKLLCQNFRMVGKKDGLEVFSINYVKPTDPACNWLPLAMFVVAAAAVVVSAFDYSKTVVKDGQGNVTSTTTTTSFGGGGLVRPSNGNGGWENEEYEIDHLYVESFANFGAAGEPFEQQGNIGEVIITGQGFPSMVITDEVYNTTPSYS